MAASRRVKPLSLLAAAALAGAGLLAWAMPWFTVRLASTETATTVIEVAGDTAAPAVAALSIAALALVAALAIAGRYFRVALAVLQALIGLGIVVSAAGAIGDPRRASAPLVTAATGIDGADSVAASIAQISTGPWPAVAVAVGALMIVLGAAILATGRLWPGPSRKYQTGAADGVDAPRTAVSDWDSLSDGDDPTGEPPTDRL